jgi:hypothetical protein
MNMGDCPPILSRFRGFVKPSVVHGQAEKAAPGHQVQPPSVEIMSDSRPKAQDCFGHSPAAFNWSSSHFTPGSDRARPFFDPDPCRIVRGQGSFRPPVESASASDWAPPFRLQRASCLASPHALRPQFLHCGLVSLDQLRDVVICVSRAHEPMMGRDVQPILAVQQP